MTKKHRTEDWGCYWNPQKRSLGKAIIDLMRVCYFNRRIISLVGNVTDKTVLEAGCGTSESLVHLSKKAKKAYGLDLSKDALILSERSFKKKGIASDKYELTMGNITSMPFHDNVFDVVFNAGVIEHFTDLSPIKEMIRVTKPGGRVVILVPAIGLYQHVFKIVEKLTYKEELPWEEHKFYDKEMMRKELLASGAKRVKVFKSYFSLGVYMVGIVYK